MSSINTGLLASDDPISDVAGLLARGALVISDSREARARIRQIRVHATWLRQEARALILGSNPHSLQPISGGTDVNHDKARIRGELHAFASFGTPKTIVSLSRGATCDACAREICTGEIEYQVVADGHEMRLESDCYLLLVDELGTLQPGAVTLLPADPAGGC